MTTIQDLEGAFPRLSGTSWRPTSPEDHAYNCIGWAAGDDGAIWWPRASPSGLGIQGGFYWPPSLPLVETIDNFVVAFRKLGYRECTNDGTELGWEKIALFASSSGEPTHAARQLPDGRWTSKLGQLEDIQHDSATDIGGTAYGEVVVVMRRKVVPVRPHPRQL